jgi:heptosyltransferase II
LEILIPEKILIIQTAFLGDAVLTLPAIQKLKEKFPNAHISILCIPSTKDLFNSSPSIQECIVYDKRGEQKSFSSFFKLIMQIRGRKYSRVFSFHRSYRSAIISCLLGADDTVGFDTSNFKFLYKRLIKYSENHHEVERNLELIGENIKNEEWKIIPEIKDTPETEQKIEQITQKFGKKNIVAIAPGSVWETKIYPKKYYLELIKYLVSINYFVVLIGGKDDEQLCMEFENEFLNVTKSLAGKLSSVESIFFLKKCKLLISNDSAPTHLGMAADIPVLTIYCSTIPSFGFYPYNKKSEFLSFDELECKPCGIHGHKICPIKTFDCGNRLLPSDVISRVKFILNA